MIFEKILAERKQIQEELQSIDEQLATLPEGKLICTKVQQDSNVYYKWYHGDGHKKKYISKSNWDLAQKLAVKKYLLRRIAELNKNYYATTLYLNHHASLPDQSIKSIIEHPEFSKLLAPFFKPTSQELYEWSIAPYPQNPSHPEALIHRSMANRLLHSKSESIIDVLLYTNKIPFRYECELKLGETVVYPDFTIRHPQTGKLYYWEHFGMIDNPTYSKNMYSKLQLYNNHGIYQSVNLIVTYETKDNPMNIGLVNSIIEQYFL